MANFYTFYQLQDPGGSPVTSTKVNIKTLNSGQDTISGFTATEMSRGTIADGGTVSDAFLDITFTSSNEFAKSRMLRQFENRWWVDIAYTATDTPFWRGVLRRAKPNRNTIILSFTAVMAALNKYGAPWTFQRTCRYRLYDSNTCKANSSNHTFNFNITNIDTVRNEIEATTTDNVPAGRWMQYATLTQNNKFYTVYSQRELANFGSYFLTLSHRSGLATGACTISQGCDKSFYSCKNLFNNENNFGGFPQLPSSKVWGEEIIRFNNDIETT